MKSPYKKAIRIRIVRSELPSPYTIKYINLQFLINSRKGVKSSTGETTIYHLHGMTHKQMKKYIINLPSEQEKYIEKIMSNFPEKSEIHHQCAYYFRAFSLGQIFLDANHRTGYFSLVNILKKKGLIVKASVFEVTALTEYIKAQGWLKMGQMVVNLKEKDEEYYGLLSWFKDRLSEF